MRPCLRCRAPIENSAVNCTACGATQDSGPRVHTEPPSPPRAWLPIKAFSELLDVLGLSPLIVVLILAAYLSIGGAIGYFVAAQTGSVVGVLAMILLLFGAMAWSDLRR